MIEIGVVVILLGMNFGVIAILMKIGLVDDGLK